MRGANKTMFCSLQPLGMRRLSRFFRAVLIMSPGVQKEIERERERRDQDKKEPKRVTIIRLIVVQ